MTFKLRVFPLWQTNDASYEESTSSPVRGLFFVVVVDSQFSLLYVTV